MDEGKIEAEAEVDLYLMILEKEGKYEEILKIAESPLGRFLSNHLEFFTRRKALIHLKLNNYSAAFELLKQLLLTHPDQVEFYEKLFEIALMTNNTHEHDLSGSKKYIFDTINMLKESTEEKSPHYKLRGPHLAKIQLYYLLKCTESDHPSIQDLPSLLAENPTELFAEYFHLFGHKTACCYDFIYILTVFKSSRNNLGQVSFSLI